MCTHDHVGGDECLSFYFDPALVDTIGGPAEAWQAGCLPPRADMMVLGELAQAAATGRSAIGVDEVGLLLAGRFVDSPYPGARAGRRTRRHAIAAARSKPRSGSTPIRTSPSSSTMPPREAGLSPFHFLRLFSHVLGVTPHQYLVRSRLRHAARLLADDEPSRDRRRLRRRLRRPLELRPHLPPRRRGVPPRLSQRRERRPQDLPRSPDGLLATMTSFTRRFHEVTTSTTTSTEATTNSGARVLLEGYGGEAWHGPDLKAALADVSTALAFWRPAPGRHNIAEIALHHAYYAHSVRGRLSETAPEPFVLERRGLVSAVGQRRS